MESIVIAHILARINIVDKERIQYKYVTDSTWTMFLISKYINDSQIGVFAISFIGVFPYAWKYDIILKSLSV